MRSIRQLLNTPGIEKNNEKPIFFSTAQTIDCFFGNFGVDFFTLQFGWHLYVKFQPVNSTANDLTTLQTGTKRIIIFFYKKKRAKTPGWTIRAFSGCLPLKKTVTNGESGYNPCYCCQIAFKRENVNGGRKDLSDTEQLLRCECFCGKGVV